MLDKGPDPKWPVSRTILDCEMKFLVRIRIKFLTFGPTFTINGRPEKNIWYVYHVQITSSYSGS